MKIQSLLKPCKAYCLQYDVVLGGVVHNMKKIRSLLGEIKKGAGMSLVVLPELCLSGFDYNNLQDHAVHTPDVLAQFTLMAREHQVYLAGSLPEITGSGKLKKIYNTMFITGPEGVVGQHRKQQLFAPMGERGHFAAGFDPQPVDTDIGRLGALVCYDLRFPELARSQAAQGANLLMISAQWPTARRAHWRYLVIARAIENQMFVVACNRCGKTGETGFGGHSMIVSPDGKVLAEAASKEDVLEAEIDPVVLHEVRQRFNTVAVKPFTFADKKKIVDLVTLKSAIVCYKQTGRKIVFTNGCFDILHEGHVTYLEKARRLGDCLVVGLNSDASVKGLKGSARPVNSELSRARVLAALGCVDFVVIFNEETPLKVIKGLMPDILAKGGDWTVDRIVGAKEVMAAGGWALSIPLVENFSTTAVIQKMKKIAK